jgi:hypothetical protein
MRSGRLGEVRNLQLVALIRLAATLGNMYLRWIWQIKCPLWGYPQGR